MNFDYDTLNVALDELVDNSIVVITDDFDGVTGPWVAEQFQLDDVDEGLITETTKDFKPREKHIIVDRQSVEKTLKSLHEDALIFIKREKNNRFKSEYNLSKSDLRDILNQLSIKDYTYSIKSKHKQFLGDMLTVFITGKDFKLKDGRSINNLVLYIKVDDSPEGFVTIISIHESERPDEESHPYTESLENTHTEYYILYSTIGELCNLEHTDKGEANDHIDDAMESAVADLTKQVESSINSVLPEPTAKVKAYDDQAQAIGEGSVAMLIYIDKSISRKDAFKAIANGINCVGIGTTTFETTDLDNYSVVHADDHIPHCYAGWREYGTIDASADVCLTITKYDELDDDGFIINN